MMKDSPIHSGFMARLIVPATHAAERSILNSKPSLETSVTYSLTFSLVIVIDCAFFNDRVFCSGRSSVEVRAGDLKGASAINTDTKARHHVPCITSSFNIVLTVLTKSKSDILQHQDAIDTAVTITTTLTSRDVEFGEARDGVDLPVSAETCPAAPRGHASRTGIGGSTR